MRAILTLLLVAFASTSHAAEDKVYGKSKEEWLNALQNDPSPRIRRAAVIALRIIGPTQRNVARALQDALRTDKELIVRRQILQILNDLRAEDLREWLPHLTELLKNDPELELRATSLQILAKMGDLAKPALSNLVTALSDHSPLIRMSALAVIAKMGEAAKSAVPDVQKCLSDTQANVRDVAIFALGRMGKEAIPALSKLLEMLQESLSAEEKKQLAIVLGQIDPESRLVFNTFVKLLGTEKDAETRQRYVQTLSKFSIPDADSLGKLREMVRSESDLYTRMYLIRYLANPQFPRPTNWQDQLGNWLEQESSADVKKVLLEEIGLLGPAAEKLLPLIKKSQRDANVSVRDEATAAIKKITAPAPKLNP